MGDRTPLGLADHRLLARRRRGGEPVGLPPRGRAEERRERLPPGGRRVDPPARRAAPLPRRGSRPGHRRHDQAGGSDPGGPVRRRRHRWGTAPLRLRPCPRTDHLPQRASAGPHRPSRPARRRRPVHRQRARDAPDRHPALPRRDRGRDHRAGGADRRRLPDVQDDRKLATHRHRWDRRRDPAGGLPKPAAVAGSPGVGGHRGPGRGRDHQPARPAQRADRQRAECGHPAGTRLRGRHGLRAATHRPLPGGTHPPSGSGPRHAGGDAARWPRDCGLRRHRHHRDALPADRGTGLRPRARAGRRDRHRDRTGDDDHAAAGGVGALRTSTVLAVDPPLRRTSPGHRHGPAGTGGANRPPERAGRAHRPRSRGSDRVRPRRGAGALGQDRRGDRPASAGGMGGDLAGAGGARRRPANDKHLAAAGPGLPAPGGVGARHRTDLRRFPAGS